MKLALVLALGMATLASAPDDPVVTLPEAYQLQFENEWVKVVRVTYAPRVNLPAHDHAKYAAAYVYLNDAGPVAFRHVGKDYHTITRPATKARSFRLFKAVNEEHEVENLSDTTSEFLRVEFKTDPQDEDTLRGRFYSERDMTGERLERVQFDNAQVRVTRLTLPPGRGVHLTTAATEPALLIAVTPAPAFELTLGHARWIPAGERASLENTADAEAELLRFDFKTPPLTRMSR